jgi:flagellar biosynthesis/type III secretory pathway protein FliH
MSTTDNKFDKFQFDTDFFEVLTPEEVLRAEEAEQSKEQAYNEGFTAGQNKVLQDMQQQLTQQLQTMHNISQQIQHQQDVYVVALGRQALQIINQTLHQILDHAAEHYPQEILEKHLRDVIPQVPGNMPLTLKIHPDATTFHEKLGAPEATIQGRTFTIQTDPNIAPGDCVVIWDNGGVEASLKQAKQSITQLLNNTPPDPTIPAEEPEQPAPAQETAPEATETAEPVETEEPSAS